MSEPRPSYLVVTAGTETLPRTRVPHALKTLAARHVLPLGMPLLAALALVVAMEAVARGGLADIGSFLLSSGRPGPAAVLVVFLLLLAGDALFGRLFLSLMAVGPLLLVPAFISSQKQLYLSDPLYPTDMLFGRQIFELLPAMAAARPLAAAGTAAGVAALVAGLAALWLYVRPRLPPLDRNARLLRLAIALPLLAGFASIMDYREYSQTRARLGIVPIVWDQTANYRHNGLLLAFTLNVPMASIASPAGYGPDAVDAIPASLPSLAGHRGYRPDVIMVMSESLWDPTRLERVSLHPDPMPWIRRHQSGHVFSPEFGGMTANVEFEALTGFSNAFFPTGAIPYQQYVRGPLPSLATFFHGEGYATLALHPFQEWFWNRGSVYRHFGFQAFLSEENLPAFAKRGKFAADADFTEEIIRQADGLEQPFFMFAVTLQGHGPYEPNRYARNTISVDADVSEGARAAIATYAQGVHEADESLKRLMEWARKRKRETIVVFFGDHLPPLGNTWVETGTMEQPVASRNAEPDVLRREHETPLVLWSSRSGIRKSGTVSPAFLPYFVLKMAGFEHPYYTGFLGSVQERYPVVDRHMLMKRDGHALTDWNRTADAADPRIEQFRLLQYDIMFGQKRGLERFFPSHMHVAGNDNS